MSTHPGIEVGLNSFTDLVYANDTALFLTRDRDSTEILSGFCSIAALLGLRVSWAKTKLQDLGFGPRPAALSIKSKLVDTFVYLGSLQSSDGYCWPDVKLCIGLAASVVTTPHLE